MASLDHILPEVRPVVTNMPEETYVAQTQGSARSRTLPLDVNVYRVSGVPGHTHNSTAITSVSADFSSLRAANLVVTDDWAPAAFTMAVGEHDDSVRFDSEAEVRMYDRALEKGIGRIALVPENCHQQIDEPARAVAEIRTIVTSRNQLEGLTYIEEEGGWVDPVTGKHTDRTFGPVYIDMVGYSGTQTSDPFATRVAATNIIARDSAGTIIGAVVVELNAQGVLGTLVDGSEWDGTVEFEWDEDSHRYVSVPLAVTLASVTFVEVIDVDTIGNDLVGALAADGAGMPADFAGLRITFEGHKSTVAEDGNCMLVDNVLSSTVENLVLPQGDKLPAPPRFEIDVDGAHEQFPGVKWYWHGPPAYRIPVGGDLAIPGPGRVLAHADLGSTDFAEGRSMFETYRNVSINSRFRIWRDEYVAFREDGAFAGAGPYVFTAGPAAADGPVISGHGGINFETDGPNRNPSLLLYDSKRQIFRDRLQRHVHMNRVGVDAVPVRGCCLTGNAQLAKFLAAAPGATDFAIVPGWGIGGEMAHHYSRGDFGATPLAAQMLAGVRPKVVYGRSTHNFDIIHSDRPAPGEKIVTFNITRAALPAAARAAVTAVQDVLVPDGSAVSTVPLHMRYVHSHLKPTPSMAAGAEIAGGAGTVPHIVTAALLADALADVDPGPGTAEEQALAAFYAIWRRASILIDAEYGIDNTFGLQKFVGRLADGTILVDAGGDVSVTLAHVVAAEAAVPTVYFTPMWDEADMVGRQVVGSATAGAPSLAPFYAIGDVDSASVAGGNVETKIDISCFFDETRITSTAGDAFFNHYVLDDLEYLQEAPVQSIQFINASNVGEEWGFDAVAANATAGSRLGPHFGKAGIGEKLEVPPADITWADGEFLSLKHFALATMPAAEGASTRYAHFYFNNIGRDVATDPAVIRVDLRKAMLSIRQSGNNRDDAFEMFTEFVAPERLNAAGNAFEPITRAQFLGIALTTPTFNNTTMGPLILIQFDTKDFTRDESDGLFGLQQFADAARKRGLVFRSKKRISQPLCAPLMNPNVRIGCLAPLNFDTRHLPPELRDFQLTFFDVDFSFLPKPTIGDWTIGSLKTYEFAGGNQVATSQGSLLYLPEFKLYQQTTVSTTFDLTCYSSTGMPSYFAFFCRFADSARGSDYNKKQPLIETLNIECDTTKRKSDVVTDNLGKHQLFHLTQRNVHPASNYNSTAYNRRQVVLLSAEDIGLMSLQESYQSLRRVRFKFTGTVNMPGKFQVVFVYNNRGLEVDGADIKVVRL